MVRAYPYGVKIKTRKTPADIEAWVMERVRGSYYVMVQENLGDGRQTLAIFFAEQDDRDAFKAAYRRSKGKSA